MATTGSRVVITGATGLIGPQLAAMLVDRGDHVIALVRNPERAAAVLPHGVELHRWSSSMAGGSWAAAIDGADAVVNLAGATVAERWTAQHRANIRTTRIDATRNIVAAIAAAAQPPRVLVNASAVGYYGTSPTAVFTEQSPHGADLLAEICAEWEAEAVRAAEFGTRVACVRIGIVLDTASGALQRLLLPFRLGVGGPVAPGSQWFPWVHSHDTVRMIQWAIDTEAVHGPVNAVAPGIVRNQEFARALGRALHRPSFFKVPKFVIRMILGGGAYILTEGQHVVPERSTNLGFQFKFPELPTALTDLLKRKA